MSYGIEVNSIEFKKEFPTCIESKTYLIESSSDNIYIALKNGKEYTELYNDDIKYISLTEKEEELLHKSDDWDKSLLILLKSYLGKPHSIECDVIKSGSETGYKQVLHKKVHAIGSSMEDCLNIVFKQINSWTYCNDINLRIPDRDSKKAYTDFFYGEDGIKNYAAAGGDMW